MKRKGVYFGFVSGVQRYLDITPGSAVPTYALLAAGVTGYTHSDNEKLDETVYLDSGGFQSSDVVGKQNSIDLTGHRLYGNPAQDYIGSIFNRIQEARNTTMRTKYPNGDEEFADVTITNIKGFDGNAGEKMKIAFSIKENGEPMLVQAKDILPFQFVRSDPIDQKVDVPVNRPLSMTFTDTVDIQSFEPFQTVFLLDAVAGIFLDLTCDISSLDQKTVIFTPKTSLNSLTKYILEVNTGARSVTNQRLNVNAEIEFVTSQSAVTFNVSSVVPANNATNVDELAPIIVRFDSDVNPTTITAQTLKLMDDADVDVSYTRTVVDNTVTITPSAALTSGATYTVTVTTAIRSVSNQILNAQVMTTFTVA